jgi:uncharacterized protein
MIWDLHCHIATCPGRTPDERMYWLIQHANRMGIDRLCIYMGMKWSDDPTPVDFRQQNDEVLEALTHWHHRAFGFAYINPKYRQESLDEINRCIRDGPMTGIKLWVAEKCSSKDLDPIVERCAELKAIIFQHTWLKVGGMKAGESSPMDLAALAGRHPDVPMICGHTGGDWEIGIRAVRAHKNVSVDLAGFDPTAGVTEMAVRELDADRVLYGSDCAGRSFASQLAKVYGADIPEAAKKLILGENLRRMMLPILKAKGMRA